MTLRVFLAGMVFVVLGATEEPAVAQSLDNIVVSRLNDRSVVFIKTQYTDKQGDPKVEYGTGFIVSTSGHVLTNAHVAIPEDHDRTRPLTVTARIATTDSPELSLTRVDYDATEDTALLKFNPQSAAVPWRSARLGSSANVPQGATLRAIGFPNAGEQSIVQGTLSSRETVLDGERKPWWQVQLPLYPGNSGGPIFDSSGALVAMAVKTNDFSPGMSYVIPIDNLRDDYAALIGWPNYLESFRRGETLFLRLAESGCPQSDARDWTGDNDPLGTITCGQRYSLTYSASTKTWTATGFHERDRRTKTFVWPRDAMNPRPGNYTPDRIVIWGASFDYNSSGMVFAGPPALGGTRAYVGNLEVK